MKNCIDPKYWYSKNCMNYEHVCVSSRVSHCKAPSTWQSALIFSQVSLSFLLPLLRSLSFRPSLLGLSAILCFFHSLYSWTVFFFRCCCASVPESMVVTPRAWDPSALCSIVLFVIFRPCGSPWIWKRGLKLWDLLTQLLNLIFFDFDQF